MNMELNEAKIRAIRDRIELLKTAADNAGKLLSDWEIQNTGRIPRDLAQSSVDELIERFLKDGWDLSVPVKAVALRRHVIMSLAWTITPTVQGLANRWIIPPQYQEGRDLEFTECFLIRVCWLLYRLTNQLLGPMAAQEIRNHYNLNQIEWRTWHNYTAELEAEMALAGLRLIDPMYSQRHARDLWDQDLDRTTID
jgi:hypothetical protein